MHCDCCDKELNESEISAKYVEKDGSKPHRFVNMCKECRSFLPPGVKWVSRPDKDREQDDDSGPDPFDLTDYEDEDERW